MSRFQLQKSRFQLASLQGGDWKAFSSIHSEQQEKRSRSAHLQGCPGLWWKIIRRSQGDEYLAGRFYQIESKLPGALGLVTSNSKSHSFSALEAWPYDKDQDDIERTGGDSHCAMEDVWKEHHVPSRPLLYCPVEGCPKDRQGKFNFKYMSDSKSISNPAGMEPHNLS